MGLKPLYKNILNFSLSLMFSQIIFEISLGDINLKLKKNLVKTKAGEYHREKNTLEPKAECYANDKVKRPPVFRSLYHDF